MSQFKLLNVKQHAEASDDKVSIVVSIQNTVTEESFSRTVTPTDEKMYAKVIQLIQDYQQANITPEDFEEKLIQLIMVEDIQVVSAEVNNSKYLSAHVSISDNKKIYFDGHEINHVLERELLALLRERDENDSKQQKQWIALINFAEKLYTNTSPYVREQLYGWMQYQMAHGKLTLTVDGNFIAYKGGKVTVDDNGETCVQSIHAGHGFVNGVEFEHSYLPNHKGDIIEIPRDEVDPDPAAACSIGLHVGSYDYASSFAEGATMTIEVDPINVVSVPSDYDNQKIRVCKYKVIDIVKNQLDAIVYETPDMLEDEEDNLEVLENREDASDEQYASIEYITSDGLYKTYNHPRVVKDNHDTLLIDTGDGYKTLRKDRIQNIELENTSEDDMEIPDFTDIEYTKINGGIRSYYNPTIVDINHVNRTITIQTQELDYKTLLWDNIRFLNI